jgi:tetratricopeptide (TPR) repeat protein
VLNRLKRWLDRGSHGGAPAVAPLAQQPQKTSTLEAALSERPDDAELNYRVGLEQLASGDAAAALDYFHLALHFAPDLFPACAARAQALAALQRHADAAYREFLDANPGHPGAAYALAVWHHGRGEYDEALALLQPLADLRPIQRDACSLLGLILARELGRFAEGERLLRRALEPDPQWPVALSNLGWILMERGDYARGLDLLDAVLERNPEDQETRLARGYMKLKHGDFEGGWRDFEARHHSRFARARDTGFERWDGAPMPDRTLLISAEQGLGDQIMFASCFSDVIARSGHCLIECNPKLLRLFQRSFPDAVVCAEPAVAGNTAGTGSPQTVDRQIPMGSLPGLFRRREQEFPRHAGYLHAAPERVAYWRSRLDELGPGLKIGVSWRGGIAITRRHLRSFALEEFLPVLRQPARFVSLQYGDCRGELSAFSRGHGVGLPHWQDALDDYDETAALVCALDLVVSVCTAVIHLAGALGQPVWVLVPAIAEWRYLDHGETLPWYPSARLFRQAAPGDWGGIIAKVAAECGRYAGRSPGLDRSQP